MLRWLAGAALLALLAPAARAQCTAGAAAVNLGTYTGVASTSGTASLTVNCPLFTSFVLGLNAGTASGATVSTRSMTGPGGSRLQYSLFQNASRTTNWGNTSGTDTESGSGFSNTLFIYPRIAGGQLVTPGLYLDTLLLTNTAYFLGISLGSVTQNVIVTATVPAACAISASEMAFGLYNRSASSTTTATLAVTCTNSTPYTVGLDAGSSPGATVFTRAMTGSGGGSLFYHLYQDAAHTNGWNTDSYVESGIGNGAAQMLTVYGIILSGQNADPDSYADTVIATVTY